MGYVFKLSDFCVYTPKYIIVESVIACDIYPIHFIR